MKLLLRLLLVLVLCLIISGTICNQFQISMGNKLIGFGALLLAFVLMPLFIYVRFSGKDIQRYSIKNNTDKKPN